MGLKWPPKINVICLLFFLQIYMWSFCIVYYLDLNANNLEIWLIKFTFSRHFHILSIKRLAYKHIFFFRSHWARAWTNKICLLEMYLSKTNKWQNIFLILSSLYTFDLEKERKNDNFFLILIESLKYKYSTKYQVVDMKCIFSQTGNVYCQVVHKMSFISVVINDFLINI